MQTQDVILYGEVPEPNRDWEEWQRAGKLCEWGMPLGLDGFVRMEFHLYVVNTHTSALMLRLLTFSMQRSNLLQLLFGPHPSRKLSGDTADGTTRYPTRSMAQHGSPDRQTRWMDRN